VQKGDLIFSECIGIVPVLHIPYNAPDLNNECDLKNEYDLKNE